jgi:pectin methylesterase-like acyl-CoA thioesterase
MNKHKIAAILCAVLSMAAHAAFAGACPGAAGWCDDFESGAARWTVGSRSATGQVRTESATTNHLLRANDSEPLLVAAGETATLTQSPYYVEARLRPSAGAGRAYLMAQYVDDRNWVGVSVGFTPGSKRLALELVSMQDGELVRLKRVGRDTEAGTGFHTLRLEMAGAALSAYLNGERVTSAPAAFKPGGQAGVLAQGGEFDIDDMRIGAAGTPPGRIALARMTSSLHMQAGDAPQRYPVSAFSSDGVTTLPFVASSSDPSVASVAVDAGALVLSAHRPGAAVITLAGISDHNVATSLAATVAPASGFVVPAQPYALQGRVVPAARAAGVPTDTVLRISFDNTPTLGASGSVRIYRAADNALIDVIRLGEEIDTIGYPTQEYKRVVRYNPIRIDGNKVTIRPHNARLAYSTRYFVTIDDGVFVGATLGGQPFTGLGRPSDWTFRTQSAVAPAPTLKVAADGPADFRTVQGALNHAMYHLPRSAPVTIRIANGRYEELLYLRAKDSVTLRGQSRDGVVIHAANHDSLNPGSGTAQGPLSPSATGGRALMLVEDADMLTLDNLTLVNTTRRATSAAAQAETLYFNSEQGRLIATNATFMSEQDTIQVKGYSWFYRTLIAGNVDFIWGYNRAALFEESEIRSVGDSSNPDNGGYVVQARTVAAGDPGFVFLNSRLTHGPGPAGNDVPAGITYLARSPGTANTWDNVSYINCRMDSHVAAVGWAGAGVLRQPASNPATPGPAAGWSEYGSMDMAGKSLNLSARVGGYLPGEAQAKARFSNRDQIFQGFDNGKGWKPALPTGK